MHCLHVEHALSASLTYVRQLKACPIVNEERNVTNEDWFSANELKAQFCVLSSAIYRLQSCLHQIFQRTERI